jgi:hypothetical protein
MDNQFYNENIIAGHLNNWTSKIKTGYNSTYPKGGVSCSADTFVQAENSVLRMKFCGKNPALRVAANRYSAF